MVVDQVDEAVVPAPQADFSIAAELALYSRYRENTTSDRLNAYPMWPSDAGKNGSSAEVRNNASGVTFARATTRDSAVKVLTAEWSVIFA
ncbi:hypothetical protein [Microtetraspora malaysiensis]|uniref:hypothetical protein n=1 Tax=Microtetraspora malaysiensis TaxID=161358 RepID=UPI003D909174